MLRTYTLNSTRATGVKGGSLGGGSPGTWGSGYIQTTGNVGFAGRSNDYYCTNMVFDVSAYTNKNIVKIELWLTISIPRNHSMPIAKMEYSSGWYGDGSIIAYVPANGSGVQKINVGTSLPTYGYVIGPYQEEIGASYSYISISNAQLVITVNEAEERTYTLTATGVGGCSGSSSGNWGNLYKINNRLCGANKDAGVTVFATYYMFDQAVLAGLKTKNVTSVKLSVYINGLPSGGSELYDLRRKANDLVGAGSSNNAWYATQTYTHVNANSCTAAGSSIYTFTLGNSSDAIPDYGFVFGPYAAYNTYYSCDLGETATLEIKTLEYDQPYILQYDANGGTNAPAAQNGTNQSEPPSYTFTISSTKPIRSGYEFLGWSLSSSATSASYQPGESITVNVTGVTTLYAVWKALNTIRIVNNNDLDIYLVYIVENNSLVPYQVNIVDENGNLIICT